MLEFYNVIDILTLTSSYGEGFSNSLGEAMACSKSCVSTNVGDSKYIIQNTGYVVQHSDPHAIAKAWERMINSDYKHLQETAKNKLVWECQSSIYSPTATHGSSPRLASLLRLRQFGHRLVN